MKIAIPINYFCSWGGGAEFLTNLANSIQSGAKRLSCDVTLLLKVEKQVLENTPGGVLEIETSHFADSIGGIFHIFLKNTSVKTIHLYSDIESIESNRCFDVISPTAENFTGLTSIPWCSYWPDMQHRHFPNFFSDNEISNRENTLRSLLKNSAQMYVNADSVKDDLTRFFSNDERIANIRRLPLLLPSNMHKIELKDEQTIRKDFSIIGNYFVSCSQQWKHKQHELIIRSAYFLKSITSKPFCIFFTGSQNDYRFPNLKVEIEKLVNDLDLNSHIRYVGNISRQDQLSLIKFSDGLIQASLFEGGPGASGTIEAAVLGSSIVSSNISTNRELTFGNPQFFPSNDDKALAKILETFISGPVQKPPPFSLDEIELINEAAGIKIVRELIDLTL